MLKFLSLLLAAAVLAAPAYARRKKAPVLEDNKAYVLYLQGCPICQNALEYINERYLTRPDVVRVDLETEEGRSLLKQCAKKFGFKSVVAPVVCIGDKHFMGWSTKAARDFDQYLVELHGFLRRRLSASARCRRSELVGLHGRQRSRRNMSDFQAHNL